MSLITPMIIVLATTIAAPSLNEAFSVVQPAFAALHGPVTHIAGSGMAIGSAVIHACRVCVGSMTASALHFDLYAGLSCGAMLQAWHACRNRRHDQAREHGMACFVHIIAALLQWHA